LAASNFNSWDAFSRFEREVRRNRRYIRTSEAEQFLDAIRRTSHQRSSKFSKGRNLVRARIGHGWRHVEEIDDEVPAAYPPKEMKPPTDRAMEGRANPKGIPMLYLCSSKDAAMSEVRPWIGSMISLGYFETTKELRLVNCTSDGKLKNKLFFLNPPSREIWDDVVWSDIDTAFTKPVTRSDDTGDYVPTQILVELFRDEGFDGVVYRSAFGEQSFNIALFDLECAELRACELYEATSVKMNFRERDGPYWVRRSQPKRKRKPGT
jgi:hypothetical protein